MPTDSNVDDVNALEEMAREFTEGFNSGNVSRIMRYYGEEYVDVNLRRPKQSHQERRDYYQGLMNKGLHVKAQPDEIRIEGEWGFVRGHVEVLRAEGQTPVELRYLEIARKQPDGTWQVIWGMDGPVQEYEPG